MNKKNVFLVNIIFLFFGMISFWLIDIGNLGKGVFNFLGNGLWNATPFVVFHIGLYLGVLVLFGLIIFNTLIEVKG